MPNVTAIPVSERDDDDSQLRTHFIGLANIASQTYTYPTTQDSLTIKNRSDTDSITVTVNSAVYTIAKGNLQIITTSFTSFDITATANSQAFGATAVKAATVDTKSVYALAVQSSKTVKNGYNLDEGLRNARNAMADIDNNPFRILGIGDSVMYGMFSSNIMSTSWIQRLRLALANKLGDNGVGWIPIPSGISPDQAQWTTTGVGWTISSGVGAGISTRYLNATGTANTVSFTFTGTSVDIVYAKATPGGIATVTVDAVAKASIDCTSATDGNFGTVQSYTGLAAGSHTVVITAPASGIVFLEGAMAYNPPASGPKGVYMYNFGEPNAAASWFTPNVTKAVQVAQPHLAIIALGYNDTNPPSNITQAAFLQSMGTLITACQAQNASVLLVAYGDTNGAQKANWINVIPQFYQLADQYNCGFIDIYTRWGKSWTLAQTQGLMGTAGVFNGIAGNDAVHPSNKGHRDIASAIAWHLTGTIA